MVTRLVMWASRFAIYRRAIPRAIYTLHTSIIGVTMVTPLTGRGMARNAGTKKPR